MNSDYLSWLLATRLNTSTPLFFDAFDWYNRLLSRLSPRQVWSFIGLSNHFDFTRDLESTCAARVGSPSGDTPGLCRPGKCTVLQKRKEINDCRGWFINSAKFSLQTWSRQFWLHKPTVSVARQNFNVHPVVKVQSRAPVSAHKTQALAYYTCYLKHSLDEYAIRRASQRQNKT